MRLPGREPHQSMEDASGRRPHFMLPGQRQPDASVSACRRLLVDVEPARADAAAFELARGTIRHPASAPDQACRTGRCVETANTAAPATGDTGSGDLCPGADPHVAPDRLTDGADAPELAPNPINPQRPTTPGTPHRPPKRAAAFRCPEIQDQPELPDSMALVHNPG